ncbi:helix-turn-helix transcriptional regulator, partial [Conexibacter sp. CPCC 205762]
RDVQAVAPDAAAGWLDAAERLLPPAADGERRRELRLRRSLALAACGRSAEAHDVLLAVHDALPPGSPLAVPAVVQLAQIERAGGRAHDARARLERALAAGIAQTPADAAQPGPTPAAGIARTAAEEARLRVGLAFSLVQLSDREAGAAVRAALAAAERAESLLEIASARACASLLAAWEGDHVAAAAAVEQALAELQQVGDGELTEALETVHLLALMAIAHERFAPADALLARGETLARRSGQDLALAQLVTYRGMSRWNLCDMDGALESVAEAVELARLLRAEALLGHALAVACHLHVRAGDRAAGERAGAEAQRIVARQQPDLLTAISRLNASLFMALDVDPARLLRDAVAAGGPQLERVDPAWTCQLAESLVLSALELGDRDAARHWAERAQALAAHTRLPLSAAKAASASALVLSAEGDDDNAVAHARDGLARAGAAAGPVHAGLARSVLGRVLAHAGERDEALRELQAAADALTACGLQRAHDVAAREIRRLGGRASGRVGRAAGAEGLRELTAREREIAALVADGVGNKQIGRALHISDKTVANLLSAIYAKLGLRGRAELAALVAGRPLDG